MEPDTLMTLSHRRTRIKFCGFTREEDVRAAVAAGPDALGLVFFPGSRRSLSVPQARQLRALVPAFVDVVTLFVNPEPEFVQEVIQVVAPDILQFHGDETPEECERYGRRYMKAFRVGGPGMDTPAQVLSECRRYHTAVAWLFDSYSPGFGGSGHVFDHRLLDDVLAAPDARPVVLAGGLAADSVAAHIDRLRPYAVDVSSGIEEAPGIKSPEKMAAFFEAVRRADAGPAA